MAKTKFYKLNGQASMFYDPKSKLKITKGIPGKLTVTGPIPKLVLDAVRNGHINEIAEVEFDRMINELPEATKAAIKVEQKASEPKKVVKEEDEEEEEDAKSEERVALEARLDKLNLSTKEKKKKLKLDDEELEAFLIDNE